MSNTQAINAVPRPFWIMLIAVLAAGTWAGNTAAPVFLLTTPLLAFVLFRAEVRAARERLFDEAHGLDRLPRALRTHAQRALAELPDGELRDLLTGIIQVGGTARMRLPAQYTETDFGRTIDELVGAAADTAVHAHSFAQTMRTLEAQSADVLRDDFDLLDALEKVRAAHDSRLAQLGSALRVLSEIGPDIAEAGDAGTRRIMDILELLRQEISGHEQAETEIERLLAV